MAGTFFCEAHREIATQFCLCRGHPLCLCAACIPKHEDKRLHDVFPMDYFDLYSALGNDKKKLKLRYEAVNKSWEFLYRTTAREAAVRAEANELMIEFVKCYQGWLESNNNCFNALVETIKGEIALLKTMPQIISLSPLTQVLVERSHLLSAQEESFFCHIPEKDSIELLIQHCRQVLAKTPTLQLEEYANEVQNTFIKLLLEAQPVSIQVIQQTPAQGDAQKLIAVLQDQVRYFDLESDTWKLLFAFRPSGLNKGGSKNIQVDDSSSSTFIPPNRILVCGGGYPSACTCHLGSSAYILKGDGSVQELPQMSTERWGPGVTWDSVRQAFYVFGGYNGRGTYYTDYLRTSEMFLSKWSPLPDMHHTRQYFNPCWHSSIVYLCGGVTNSVETYDPLSYTFALQDFILPESSYTTSVVENGTLTVISENYISKLQQGRLISQKHGNYYPWSNCTPLVSGGVVYIYWNGSCSCIDLTTGAVLKEVSLS